MKKSTTISAGRHCVFNMHAHLVFVTKYRKKVFTKNMMDTLQTIFSSVCTDFEAELVEFEGECDHVHLLVTYPPKLALSKLVNSLKGVSSRMLRRQFNGIQQHYWKGVLWSPSYLASSCGGAPIDILKQYIREQQAPD